MSENKDDAPVKSFELVTEELVKNALVKDKGKEAELVSFEVKPFTNKGDNNTTVVSEVLVKYRLNGCEFDVSYVAKLNPLRPLSSLTKLAEHFFGRETDFFSIIVGGMNDQLEKVGLPFLKTPKLYSRYLEKGKEAFLMENLKVKGFQMYDKRKGMDLSHCTLVMKELGRFHASSLLFEETLYPKTIPESFFYFKETWFDENSDFYKILEMFLTSQIQGSCTSLKKTGQKYEKCEKWLTKHRNEMTKYFFDGYKPKEKFSVLAHGDCWTNNMLFKYDEDKPIDIIFVDLQCSQIASPASDLNYFFFTSLNGDFRSDKRDALIQIYYESFREVLERSGKAEPFSIKELKEEVKSGNLFGLCCSILTVTGNLAEGDEITDFDNCKAEEFDQFLKLGRENFEKISERPAFKVRFLSVFDEMMDDNLFD